MGRIVVVTPNPAVDVTYQVARQLVGDTVRVLDVAKRPGGKGINVARVLSAIGYETTSVIPLGGNAGSWVKSELARLGMPVAAVDIEGETRTTTTVTDAESHPTVYAEAGPVISAVEAAYLTTVVREQLDDATVLVVSGSLPQGLPPSILTEWVEAAHGVGVPVLIDASGPALLAAAGAGADVVGPNEQELLEATGAATLQLGVERLRALGAGLVVVSQGSRGMFAMGDRGEERVSAFPGITGNPTGAGDAATAGLASAIIDHLSLSESLRRAAALGAAAVLRPVAGEVDLDAYERFLSHAPGKEETS